MLKTLYKISTGLIIALGLLHITFTWMDYAAFTLNAMWFLGTGVAIVLAGFMNLVLLRDVGKDRLVQLLCHLTNVTFALLFARAIFILSQPQVFFGLGLFTFQTLIAFMLSKRANH